MAATQASSNRRIAKNTVALYLRMFLTMIVGFYTSRVVLNTLGVQDYGIYGVVGGVIAMMGFLNAAMAGATSRFLTFELGRGDSARLARTFSSALIIHMGIALVVMVLGETVGLWFLCNKLVIPPSRMEAAHWVYQLSILSSMIGITQAPYDASIISHEKMNVYAYVEILNSLLKLAIVYLLVLGHFDKLKLYAVLTLAVSVTIMLIYRVYCLRHFKETHFHWVWDKAILKPMLSFSGWDLYGNACVTARQQGINFLINMFFGVTLNAASSIATTVNGVVQGLIFNVITAFRPQIIKQYAQDKVEEMQNLMTNAITITIVLFGILLTPCFLEMPLLLHIWLGIVPAHAIDFCRILLFSCIIGLINSIVNIGNHATGNIKYISFITGSILLTSLPAVYIFFKLNFSSNFAYYTLVIVNILVLSSDLVILKKQISSFSIYALIKRIAQGSIVVAIAAILSYIVYRNMQDSFWRLFVVTAVNLIVLLSVTYCFLLDDKTRKIVKDKLCQRFQS